MPFFPKFVELPKGHPDVLFSVPDRPGLHKEPERTSQTLALPYRSRSQRRPLRALDMPLSQRQRERFYLAETHAPRPEGRLARIEQHSPAKRVSFAGSVSPRSPRTPRTPVIVEPHSPDVVYAEDTFARLPDFHPAQLPKPDPYPVFIHSQQPPSSKQTKYESDSDDDSVESEEYAKSDGAQYEVRAPPRRRHRKQISQEAPDLVFETERYKRREEIDYAPVEAPRRSRSHRDSGRDDHRHRHHSYHSHHHRHHRSASRPRHVRSEPDRDRGRDFLAPAPEPPRPRTRKAPASNPDNEVKGMLEDPRDVRSRELFAERQFFGNRDGKKVTRTEYHYR